MSPTQRKNADVHYFIRGDEPLQRAWKVLEEMVPYVNSYMYLWSENLPRSPKFKHHFRHVGSYKYLEIIA